jgi:hypothetical protein
MMVRECWGYCVETEETAMLETAPVLVDGSLEASDCGGRQETPTSNLPRGPSTSKQFSAQCFSGMAPDKH